MNAPSVFYELILCGGFCLCFLYGNRSCAVLPLVYADRAGAVTDNIESRTAHIEETVYAVDDSDVYRIDSDRLENPAVPMEASVAVTTIIAICVKLRSIPMHLARKTAATHW